MGFEYRVLIQHYRALLDGLYMTIFIFVMCLASGTCIGLSACMGKMYGRGMVRRAATFFIDSFRTVPEIVLVFWAFYCLPLVFDVQIPGTVTGIIALSLYAGAFLAEIFRAGIQAVPQTQLDAAAALCIPSFCLWRKILLPQAVRRLMPAFMNFMTELLKATALLMTIGIGEMTYRANTLGQETFHFVEYLTAVAIAYFALIFPLSLYARAAERGLAERTGQ
jgi:His/Glu/Gln/Arg/opine family amino acid ABC transporter permease subunit